MGTRLSSLMQTSPGAHPDFYTMGTRSLSGVKQLGHGVNHPCHLTLRLKKEQSYTSAPLYDFMTGYRVQFTFYFLETNVNLF
jgi:hypothetical protein